MVMAMTFTGTPASFVCLTGCRAVCTRVCFSIWHKGYGLSYRGDRWYVYRRMFAFCTIFNYRVCVCVTACVYTCKWESVCACLVNLCVTNCVWKGHRPLSITPRLFASFIAVILLPKSNPNSISLRFFFFPGKCSNPNINLCYPLFTGVATQHK